MKGHIARKYEKCVRTLTIQEEQPEILVSFIIPQLPLHIQVSCYTRRSKYLYMTLKKE